MERFVIVFSSFALPLVCYLIEMVFPRPEIVEELLKLGLILLLANKINFAKRKYEYILTLGLVFALTELIFYSINFYIAGDINLAFIRFFITSSLHLTTFFLLVKGVLRKNEAIILGSLALSVIIHFLYNYLLNKGI